MTDYFSITAVSNPHTTDFVTLRSLGIPDPLRSYKPYSKPQTLGDGGYRLAGWPVARWHWNFLKAAQRTLLRAYCAGAYAENVHIHTINEANAWIFCKTIMLWSPDDNEWMTDDVIDFNLTFKVLEVETIIDPPT